MDAIRAVAAIAVVVSHARDLVVRDYDGQLVWSPFYLVTGFGRQAVIVFFVISGFWIGKAVLDGASRGDFWRTYLINRFTRLYIVLIPALLLGGLLDYIGHSQMELPIYVSSDAHSMKDVSVSSLTIPNFFGNAAYLQTIFVPVFGTNGPLWSLAYEFWFYIWFPAVVLLLLRRGSLALLALLLAYQTPGLMAYFGIWLLGVAVFALNRALEKRGEVNATSMQRSLVLIASLGLLGASLLASTVYGSYLGEVVLALSFSIVLIVLLRLDGILWSPPLWLARIGSKSSFSIYIIHFPVLVLALGLTQVERLPIDAVSATWVALLTVFAVTVGIVFSVATEAHTKRLQGAIHRKFKRREN